MGHRIRSLVSLVGLVLFVGAVAVSTAAAQCVVRPASIKAWWPADGNANDIVGGNNGTLVNGATYTTGKVSLAFSLDGVNDYVELGNVLDDVVVPFTIEAWVKLSGLSPGGTVIRSDDNGYYGFWFSVGPSALSIQYGNNGCGNPACRRTKGSAFSIPSDVWTHVAAIVRGPTDMTLYVNGENIAGGYSGTGGTMVHTTATARIGTSAGVSFGGAIDELAVYNRSLTACEIRRIYNAENVGKCKVDADSDADGVSDSNDNCRSTPNPTQANTDGDLAGDLCDCAVSDATLFSAPPECDGLRVGIEGNRDGLEWCTLDRDAGSATVYDLFTGVLRQWPVGSGASEACLADGLSTTSFVDPNIPASDTGVWYLVRGRNTCGVGSYGFRSSGAERLSTVCP